jgi:hypothetical protein
MTWLYFVFVQSLFVFVGRTRTMASAYAWIQTSRHGIPPLQRYPERRSGGCDRASLGKAPGTRTKVGGLHSCCIQLTHGAHPVHPNRLVA